jgi:transcription antitermination factor NusG
MPVQKEWIGLMVNGTFHHGDRKAALDQIKAALEGDLIEKKVVCSEHMATSTGEYYVFVRCHDYQSHIDSLKRNAAVVSVVPSFENPHLFTEKEVDTFAGSVSTSEKPEELREGDMVLVKDGYLKNLYGVVDGEPTGKKCRVVFSFHLRKFSVKLTVTSLQLVGNVFDRNRKPTSRQKLEVPHIDQRRQLRRKPRRKLKGSRKRRK